MKTRVAIVLWVVLALATTVAAWESHPATPKFDENGDMRFSSEHVQLSSQALTAVDSFDFIGSPSGAPLEICGKVKDFNSATLNWNTLREREFCPANFTELPDFFHSMEDYINQANACPPLADWDVEECHTFEHFMGALNSSHFPPQTRSYYEQYHRIAVAITEHSNELHDKLFLAGAESTYRDYWEECKMEALTYESIGQHYLQDQWAMGHMWARWGGPDVDDFLLTGSLSVLNELPLAKITYGTIIGGVSGMIHGWKSTLEPLWNTPGLTEDALSFYSPGVEWVRPDLPGTYPGMGDLFLAQEGDFSQQKQELADCSEEGFRQLTSFQTNPSEVSSLCWENFATNQAMNAGLNLSPSSSVSLGVLGAGSTALIGINGVGQEMTNLALTFAWAAYWHPDDTYLAEGFTSQSRDTRLTLFSVKPNDEYAEISSYTDPARNAPGDPAERTGVQPDNPLFGVRQVKYFNKCHADLYCEDPAILNEYRDGCLSTSSEGQQIDCQICDELASRFFLGDPPLCAILAPGVNPDPDNQDPPDTAEDVQAWCRGTLPETPAEMIVSTFDGAGAEFSDRWGIGPQAPGFSSGWFLPVDVAEYASSGGNPGGYLTWQGDQRDWWFFATYSSKYAGDRSFAYGKNLSFDLKAEIAVPNNDFFIPLVVLSGTDASGNPLHLFQRQSGHPTPGTDWTHYSIPLDASAAWQLATSSSLSLAVEATGEDISQVLSTLTSLRIRGEYGGYRYRGYLDNVMLGGP